MVFASEKWKPIPDWPNYEVSSLGRVRGPRKMMRTHVAPSGYERVMLSDRPNDRRVMALVHRLVCSAFIGKCPEKMQVNHKNNVRHDNRIENLEYVTAKQNCHHRKAHGTFPTGSNNGRAKLTSEQVAEIRGRRAAGEKLKPLSEEFGVHQNTIWWVVRGVTWAA